MSGTLSGLFICDLFLLEEHELVRGDQIDVSKVNVVDLHLVRADHALDHHAVEP